MLINSECVALAPPRPVALAPSHRAAPAGTGRLAGLGQGTVVCERGLAGLADEAGWTSGAWDGGDKAAVGYQPGLEGSFRPGQPMAGQHQATTVQASNVRKSAADNSTDQHNTIQVTRLVPAFRGGVGPHPGKEPWPA
jgi:hypothetical protein